MAIAFQIYGKGKPETDWRVISVAATRRRDLRSPWPILAGACITWSSRLIAVGWDFAESVVQEQMTAPASREAPIEIQTERQNSSGPLSASEILAHECGHTYQALRWGVFYLPIGAIFTWWREGLHWWNWFENDASRLGQFGGIVNGSVNTQLCQKTENRERRTENGE